MNYLAILVALLLSGTAAYFSVLGLSAIFAASAGAVMIMATELEVAKIVAAVWIHRFWPTLSNTVRMFMASSVIVLMCITSMGVFGFLSKAHIAQQIKIDTGTGQELKILDLKIENKQKEVDEASVDVADIDKASNKMLDLAKKTSDAEDASLVKNKNKSDKKTATEKLNTLKQDLITLQSERIKVQGELDLQQSEFGPIKYLANLYYGKANNEQLEWFVGWLIVVMVMTFDPLAIVMLLGATANVSSTRKFLVEEKKDDEPKAEVNNEPLTVTELAPEINRPRKKSAPWRKRKSPIPRKKSRVVYIPEAKITKGSRTRKGFIEIPDDDLVEL